MCLNRMPQKAHWYLSLTEIPILFWKILTAGYQWYQPKQQAFSLVTAGKKIIWIMVKLNTSIFKGRLTIFALTVVSLCKYMRGYLWASLIGKAEVEYLLRENGSVGQLRNIQGRCDLPTSINRPLKMFKLWLRKFIGHK